MYILRPHGDVYKKELEKLKTKVEKIDVKRGMPMTDLFSFNVDLMLPKGFQMPTIKMFDGIGYPNAHLSSYVVAMNAKVGTQDIIACFFQLILVDFALQWYSRQDHNKMMNWENICKAFLKHYECNVQIEVTRRDLKALEQEPNEAFVDYVERWRRKAAQMIQMSSEEDQVRMIFKSLILAMYQ